MFAKLCAVMFLLALNSGCSKSDFLGSNAKSKGGSQANDAGKGDNTMPDGDSTSVEVSEEENGAITETFTFSAAIKSLDILFALDTSGSMTEELDSLADKFNLFMSEVKKFGLDANIIISYNTYAKLDAISNLFKHDQRNIGSHDAICGIQDFFASPNVSWLRANVPLEVFVVTDDNAIVPDIGIGGAIPGLVCTASKFKPPAGKRATFNGIIGIKAGVNTPTCEIRAVGKEYQKLAPQTGGGIYDLCTQDWGALVTQLAADIGKRHRKLTLQKKPDMSKEVKVVLNDKPLAKEDYTYDEASNTFTISSKLISDQSDVVKITYFPK